MQLSDIPRRFPIPFASSAGGDYVRDIPKDHVDATDTDAPASLADGFPPETFIALGAGGIPPSGADFNGLLKQITAWCRWLSAGVPATFNSDFATAIGGYPMLTLLASTTPGRIYQSTVNNNTTDPDSLSSANWVAVAADFGNNANYYRLPNGKIEQWGYVALSSTGEPTASVSLVVPFADASYNVSLTPSITSASGLKDTWVQVVRSSKTATGFTVQYQHPAAGSASTPGLDGFEWRCVGAGA